MNKSQFWIIIVLLIVIISGIVYSKYVSKFALAPSVSACGLQCQSIRCNTNQWCGQTGGSLNNPQCGCMGGELKRWEFTGTSCGSYESPRKEPEPSCPNDPACPKGQYCRFSGTIDRAGGTFYVHMCECATPIYG